MVDGATSYRADDKALLTTLRVLGPLRTKALLAEFVGADKISVDPGGALVLWFAALLAGRQGLGADVQELLLSEMKAAVCQHGQELAGRLARGNDGDLRHFMVLLGDGRWARYTDRWHAEWLDLRSGEWRRKPEV